MTRVMPAHACTSAEFGETETPLEPLIFLRDEAVIEAHVVRDKDAVAHELQEAVRYFGKHRRIAHHRIGDAGQLRDPCGDGALRVDQGMPLINDLVIADLDRTNLGNTV